MIHIAYERTIERIGKLSFAYIDSILKAWHEKNITTPQEAYQEQLQRDGQAKQNKALSSPPPQTRPQKGWDGLCEPSYDLDEINRVLLDNARNPNKSQDFDLSDERR